MGKRDWGVDETFLPLGLGFEEIENKIKWISENQWSMTWSNTSTLGLCHEII